MSTVLAILGVLGMTDERRLIFPEPAAFYDFRRDIVVFKGSDGDENRDCAISAEALADHFDGDNKDLLKVFSANQQRIEQEARRKYLNGKLEPDGSVLIRTLDL